jgi:hypothetical protein
MAVLDVDLAAERIIDFYRDHFAAAGWHELGANEPMPGGFLPRRPRGLSSSGKDHMAPPCPFRYMSCAIGPQTYVWRSTPTPHSHWRRSTL